MSTLIVLAAAALTAAACGSSQHGTAIVTSSTSATSTAVSKSAGLPPFPTLTASSLQPSAQHNQNRPDVAFDPCTWIDGATVTHLGYAPETRKRTTDINAEYTFLGCELKSPDKAYVLGILSGNRTMDEGRAKETAEGAQIQDTTIGGRSAMVVRTKDPDTCDVLLQTKVGYVDFQRTIFADHLDGPAPEKCSGMTDLVQDIVARIGDN
ncbi:DUF3558 family protein [Nocardia terpenica]|uniref:DUF3558 family protein n=1 Tax=Nocardia terpenica TaxID=455432 RepID=UPI0015592CEA|nr:DUF3558 family protein [Nocardia terpenica]NQE90873.1 DUF3558 domain-containing protein [Nocardia terpenica]